MKKIRNSFLKSIDLEQAVQYDKLMNNDLMIGYYSEGLFFSELNYLTFDELVYLYDSETNENIRTYLYEKIVESSIIIEKYKSCLESNNFDDLTFTEENRILILLGLKTLGEVFPKKYNKIEMGFHLTEEELRQKEKLTKIFLHKRINKKRMPPFFKVYKYAYIYCSMDLFLRFKEYKNIDKFQVQNETMNLFTDLARVADTLIRPSKGDINTFHTKYINEKDGMLKFMYYNLISDSSDEQDFVNYLYSKNELSKINSDAIAYFYLTGGGTPFVLDKTKKISTIHNEVLDELLNIIKNNYHEDNESTETSVNNKIIKFTKK